ncbi:hypothetical protein [Janthinobacterium fluminis]|uniref:SGNH/GDSL hydrolase family protein n=1 Tax=Janthinobacterium fluminis TaxID=2987524 RepID=A0ABT5JU38_9BURK|nr:hypothetical protein [Janthinobacterium fluminis]MDC8756256.1 hypothetical protein [Janthinobacterium fluminis]
MSKTIKYIGAVDRWPELAVTGGQAIWRISQQEQRSDSEAEMLLLTGQFVLLQETSQYPVHVSAYKKRVVTLPEGQALTITGAANTTGVAYLLDPAQGGASSSQSWPIGAGALATIGPFAGQQRVLVTCSVGSIEAVVGNAVLGAAQVVNGAGGGGLALSGPGGAIPLPARVALPILAASFGDSLATISTMPLHDVSAITSASTGLVFHGPRMGVNVPSYSRGRIRFVADCGIGGTQSGTQLARDAAAVSGTRKALTDAANLGAQVCVISSLTNNIVQQVRASSTPAAIAAWLAAGYADLVAMLTRANMLGMYPIYRQLGGFSPGPYATTAGMTNADVAACVDAFRTASAYIETTLIPSLGFPCGLADVRKTCVDSVTGAWLPGLSDDGLHEGQEGGTAVAAAVVPAILAWAGITAPINNYASVAPERAANGNGFAAPAMVAVASGLASGFSKSNNAGVGTNASVSTVVQVGATLWQQHVVTPQTFDGIAKALAPSGLAAFVSKLDMPIFGVAPTTQYAAGDAVQVEFDLVIDDGAGGAPSNVLGWGVDVNLQAPSGTYFTFIPVEKTVSDGYLHVPTAPYVRKIVCPPMRVPDCSANMLNAFAQVVTYAGTTTSYRVRIANLRILKTTMPVPFSARGTVKKTAAYTATLSDYAIRADATLGAFTTTLPPAASAFAFGVGQIIIFSKVDASGNVATLKGHLSESIGGSNTQTATTQNQVFRLQSNSVGWDFI